MKETQKQKLYRENNVTSTEAFFGIGKQPENACPICEGFLEKMRAKQLEYDVFLKEIKEVNFNVLRDVEQMGAVSEYKFYLQQLDVAKELISSNKQKLYDMEEIIENYRVRCNDIRVKIRDRKIYFWNSLDTGEEFETYLPTEGEEIFIFNEEFNYSIEEIIFKASDHYPEFYHNHLKLRDMKGLHFDITRLSELRTELIQWSKEIETAFYTYKNQSK